MARRVPALVRRRSARAGARRSATARRSAPPGVGSQLRPSRISRKSHGLMSAPRPSITERTPVRARALARLVGGQDVAVADHRHAALGGHAADQVPVRRLAVALLAGAAVDRDRRGAALLAHPRHLGDVHLRLAPAGAQLHGHRDRAPRRASAATSRPRRAGLRSRLAPRPRRVIWSIGQPQLRSTKRAPRDSASRAPSARVSGFLSASCTPKNGSSGWLLSSANSRRAAAQELPHDGHLPDRHLGAHLRRRAAGRAGCRRP